MLARLAASVRAALVDSGVFALDFITPRTCRAVQTERTLRFAYRLEDGERVEVWGRQHFDRDDRILHDYLDYYGSFRGHLGKAHRISKLWAEAEVIAALNEHRLEPVARSDRFPHQDAKSSYRAAILVCKLVA